MRGYNYNEQPPDQNCPYCGTPTCADFVDVGVGFIQCGPYHCNSCGAYQIGPYDKHLELTDIENQCGWYLPSTSKKFTSGNVIDNNFVTHDTALNAYRESCKNSR